MSAVIYSHRLLESECYEAGHINDKGEVYSHRLLESECYAVGHVNFKGEVYSHRLLESECYEAGHINAKGEVYSHRLLESECYEAGHVNYKGEVYSHRLLESECYEVGHIQGSDRMAAAAALLLLLKGAGAAGGSGYSAGSAYQGESIVAKATGALTELEFDIYDRLHGRVKPCRSCGKKVTLSKYQSQNGMCFWCDELCKAAEGARKEKLAMGRSGATTGKTVCPLCGIQFRVKYPSGSSVVRTFCPNEEDCGVALRVTNGMKRAELDKT